MKINISQILLKNRRNHLFKVIYSSVNTRKKYTLMIIIKQIKKFKSTIKMKFNQKKSIKIKIKNIAKKNINYNKIHNPNKIKVMK